MACRRVSVLLLAALIAPVLAPAEGQLSSPPESLLRFTHPSDWSVGLRAQFDRRQFSAGGTELDLDMLHFTGRLGCNLTRFLHASIEAGRADTSREAFDGDNGLELGVGLEASLLDLWLQNTADGARQRLALDVDVTLTHTESDFPDGDLDWWELTARPAVRYTIRRRKETVWYPYAPEAMSARIGLALTSVDGDFGSASVGEENAVGFMVGLDVLTQNGWVAQAQGNVYAANDREISLALLYHF